MVSIAKELIVYFKRGIAHGIYRELLAVTAMSILFGRRASNSVKFSYILLYAIYSAV